MSHHLPHRHGPDLAALAAALKRAEDDLVALRDTLDPRTVEELESRIARARDNLETLADARTFTGTAAIGPFWRDIPGLRFRENPAGEAEL